VRFKVAQIVSLGALLVAMDAGAQSSTSSLWITREQRAQGLLDSGHAAEAAQLFSDARRRAYANALAGRDTEAARLLAPLHDSLSEYNRGNALARSGNLIGALASYDAALEQVPGDRDVRHNRDLVARLLESQSQQRDGQGGGSQSQRNGQQGQQAQSGQNGQQGSGAQSSPDSRAGQSGGSQAGQSPSTGGGSPQQESEQAREDAELAADLQRRKRSGDQNRSGDQQSSSGSRGSARGAEAGGAARAGGAVTDDLAWPPPKSEQALALEQWLRRIPEDPGGLLRRKFLIEHMERQEGSEP
jgi:Ca-activated chloride channel homolog